VPGGPPRERRDATDPALVAARRDVQAALQAAIVADREERR
jgi:hypothetical protein